jgi:hypothetical protein
MGVLSGLGAAIKVEIPPAAAAAESTVREWRIRYRGHPPPYAATNTDGATARDTGNTDWRGFYLGYGHTPLVFPGDTFTFTGSTDATNGATGPAICDRITITCYIKRGLQIDYRVDYSANGALTLGAAAAVDDTAVNAFTSVGRTLKLGGTSQVDDGTAVPGLGLWRLVVSRANKPYVHTGTAGKTQRTVGTLDARWIYQLYVDDPSDTDQLPALQGNPLMKFYVTSSTFWELRWGKLLDIDPFGADILGPENVGATLLGGMTADVGGVAGSIYNPVGTLKWGTAAPP